MSNTTAPTVGRIVLYWPLQCEKTMDHDQPFRADVCHVNDNGTVNISILNEIGRPSARINIPLVHDREPQPGECGWMPYQTKTHAEDAAQTANDVAAPRTWWRNLRAKWAIHQEIAGIESRMLFLADCQGAHDFFRYEMAVLADEHSAALKRLAAL